MRLVCSMLALAASLVVLEGCKTAAPRLPGECKMDCRLDVITPRFVRGSANTRFLVRVYDGCNLDIARMEPTDPASPLSARDAESGQVVRFELPIGLPAVLVVAEVTSTSSRSGATLPRYRRYREVHSSRVVVDFNTGSSDEARRQATCQT